MFIDHSKYWASIKIYDDLVFVAKKKKNATYSKKIKITSS